MPSGVWGWDTAMTGGREFRRGWSGRTMGGMGRGDRGLQLVFCCGARDRLRDWVLRNKEFQRSF